MSLIEILAFHQERRRIETQSLMVLNALVIDLGKKFSGLREKVSGEFEIVGDKIALIYRELKGLEEQFNEFTKREKR